MGFHNACVSPRTVSNIILPPYITDRLGSCETKLVPLHAHHLFFLSQVEEAERKTAVGHRLGKPHNLRHSLASFLVRKGMDVKTVQKMLRHSDVSTTLGIYAHSMSEDRLAAQDDMLAAMMTPSNAVN